MPCHAFIIIGYTKIAPKSTITENFDAYTVKIKPNIVLICF